MTVRVIDDDVAEVVVIETDSGGQPDDRSLVGEGTQVPTAIGEDTYRIFLLGGSTLKRYSEKRSACHLCALPLDEEAKPVSTRAATEGTS